MRISIGLSYHCSPIKKLLDLNIGAKTQSCESCLERASDKRGSERYGVKQGLRCQHWLGW